MARKRCLKTPFVRIEDKQEWKTFERFFGLLRWLWAQMQQILERRMKRCGKRAWVGMACVLSLILSGFCSADNAFCQQVQEKQAGKGAVTKPKHDAPPTPKTVDQSNEKGGSKKASDSTSPKKGSNKQLSDKKQKAGSSPAEIPKAKGGKTKAEAKTAANKTKGKSKQKPVVISPISVRLKSVILGEKDATIADFRGIQKRVSQLVEKLRPAVVGIKSGSGQGTGVIVSADGLVLTAAHVIGKRGRDATIVLPDGSEKRAIAMGTISRADSGILRILEEGEYPYVDIGESDPLKVGQWVMALGHPGGFDKDRASPVRVGRMLVKPGKTTLQTDCTLVGGDSGGPLFDMNGELIGIHSRIATRIQQNFHVSIDYFTDNWDSMLKELKPYLGFSLDKGEMTISRVEGPAAKARMKKGDLLKKLGKFEVKSRDDIKKALKSFKFDQKIEVVVERDKKEKKLKFQIGGK